ncbi:LacI family transcriptional regulator [Georgenia soli]|uniref:LacI family transcriptional regulator n=1 Tax=Georgenia soli TaxID=638953 RepID=A0A2A9EJD3_9MICO|nr:LacI family DNA-binding transcriptional regulator [Georgenia soli]PFG39054.1 LacI family transcriptional regulator [Georgenia soli]
MSNDDILGGGRAVSAAGLARLLGVSSAAVSYALNGRRGVSDELRRRILDAAVEHGMDIPAAALRPATQPVLGLVLADVGNPYYSEMAISVTDAARERGFEVFLSNSSDAPESVAAAVDAMIHHGVDGVLITALQAGNADVCRPLRAARIPFVQISRRMLSAEADFVGIDDLAAGAEVMDHVLDHGYTKVAVVGGPVSSSASAHRADGFRRALRVRGVDLPRAWNITGGLNEVDGARAARHLLDQPELPEVIVCGTDAIALGVIAVLAGRGLQVPDDIAVTGFDGLTTARTSLVDITTVVQPRPRMAAEAVRLLHERQRTPNAPAQSIVLPHGLYIGKSCGCATRTEKIHV